MFPVPDHLPKTGGDHFSSDQTTEVKPDPTLHLLQPLLDVRAIEVSRKSASGAVKVVGAQEQDGTSSDAGASRWSSRQVRAVRESLEKAITDNKTRSHELLKANYPTISSHIRLGDQVQRDYKRISTSVTQLEREIDAEDAEVSFLPPVLASIDRHFTALNAESRARAHIKALKTLSAHLEGLQQHEGAIYAGRGADEWVIKGLLSERSLQGGLKGSRILSDIDARYQLLRSMVAEQLSDCFKSAIALSTSADGSVIFTVQNKAILQQPKLPRSEHVGSPARPSKPPPYSIPQIFSALHKLGSLSTLLHDLQTRLIRDILGPIAASPVSLNISPTDTANTLCLVKIESPPSPKDRVDAMSDAVSFLSTHAFPPSSDLPSDRNSFLQHIQHQAFSIILHDIILPTMPSTLSNIPSWLDLIQQAATVESRHRADLEVSNDAVILPFFESEAGRAWATQRRKRVAEETRKIILGGWGGWEAVTREKEKVVTSMIEMEVSDEEDDHVDATAPEPVGNDDEKVRDTKRGSDGDEFGWGFEDEAKASKGDSEAQDEDGDVTMTQDVGWGFDESANQAGPSNPKTSRTIQQDVAHSAANGSNEASEGDGWDFDLAPSVSQPKANVTPSSPAAAKPAREAKRLGRKVAKIKSNDDDDPWGSGSEATHDSVDLSIPATDKIRSASSTTRTRPSAATEAQSRPNGADDWAWGDEPSAAPKRVKKRRKVLREEQRTIKETFLISRACEKILDMAERVLKESSDLEPSSLPSPSFVVAGSVLLAAARDIFDIYRSILPTHYATQIRDVPTLAMQMYNDARHLSQEVTRMGERYPGMLSSENDLALRLSALADHTFETQLIVQKESLMETLADVRFDEVGREAGLKNAERALNGIVHNIESLSRVLKVVLPTTTYLIVLGYLLDETIQKISADILALQDITEEESTRLNVLLGLIYPLEEIFVVEPGQPSAIVAQVPHWLKFCYISELLNANLVDILYLFDSDALIDFTRNELISLIRALFADSEKRDNAIERIVEGPKGVGAT